MPVRSLSVYLHERLAGRLDESDYGVVTFTYDPTYLAAPGAPELSLSLPLQSDPFTDNRPKPFFGGLLPEGDFRRRLASALRVSEESDFALLHGVGGDCAGAVMLLPEGETPTQRDPGYRRLDESDFSTLVREIPERPLLVGEEGVRLSLAGAQDKLPIYRDERGFALPLGGAPSSHILKPAVGRFDAIAENEAFCLALARAADLPAVNAELLEVGDRPALLVERYDRAGDAGGLRRLHQEDLCQALGIAPERKYETDNNGPSLEACFELIRTVTHPPGPNVLRFLDAVAFNYCVGNSDAHGKNFALLHVNGTELAPLYDVVCTAVYDLDTRMAMSIGSRFDPERVRLQHWSEMAEATRLNVPQLRRRLLELAHRLPRRAIVVREKFAAAGTNHYMLDRIVEVIADRAGRLVSEIRGGR